MRFEQVSEQVRETVCPLAARNGFFRIHFAQKLLKFTGTMQLEQVLHFTIATDMRGDGADGADRHVLLDPS